MKKFLFYSLIVTIAIAAFIVIFTAEPNESDAACKFWGNKTSWIEEEDEVCTEVEKGGKWGGVERKCETKTRTVAKLEYVCLDEGGKETKGETTYGGCGDCGSCNDSRYRWCVSTYYGHGTCADYTCDCRPDWEGCNGGGGAQCGNSKVESGEQCDDGNTNSGDGCSSTCQNEGGGAKCGNSKVESGEQCDDGNTNSGDGCSSTCQNEAVTCNPNEFDAVNCQRCYADGSGWSGACTDWGDGSDVGTWRSCELRCSGGPPPPPPPPSVSLSGPSVVEVPNGITLSWSSSNADSCSASGNWSGSKSTSGTETIKSKTTTADRGTYNFTLSCSGSGGSASDSLSTRVIQVPYCSIFTADPKIIILPQFSTLYWECVYADSCEIDQGIGSVNNVSGNVDVRPSKTTTYTLDCQGLDGSRQFQADVGVGFIPVWREILPR